MFILKLLFWYGLYVAFFIHLISIFQIYNTELEKVDDYDDFGDFCNTFELNRGKQKEDEESSAVGEFKVKHFINIKH